MANPLSETDIEIALSALPGWSADDDKLSKSYTFANFREAMAAMVRIGFEAEAADHHPELHNVYNRIRIALSTHDAGNKITEKDVKLAQKIEAILSPQP